jgi:ABC-type antimicrobial peptide transport system permease subunit
MICKVQHPGQPPQQPQHPEMKLVVRDNTKDYGYGSIIIKAKSSGAVDEIAKSLEGLNLRPITAQAMIEQFSQIFTIIGAILGGIGGIALFVSAIGIINTMVMATYERTKEIGVLRACGAKRSTIRRLFTFEAALLGFFGGAIGLAVSYGIAQLGNLLLDQVATEQSLPLSGLITFPIWLIGGVIVFTTLIGTLAGLYPALRASRMDPITALRYE